MSMDFGVIEAEVYLKCLQYENGVNTSEIAKYIDRNPAIVNEAIDSLISKGLLTKGENGKCISTSIDAAAEILKGVFPGMFAMLPLLSGTKLSCGCDFNIRLFNGEDGVRQIHEDTINTLKGYSDETRCMYQISSSDDLFHLMPDHQESFINKRVEHNIVLYWMAPKSEGNLQHALKTDENIRIAKFFDGKVFPFNIELDVYGDKIAIITLNEDKICGIVIEIPSVTESVRSICELLWKLL